MRYEIDLNQPSLCYQGEVVFRTAYPMEIGYYSEKE